MTKYRSIFLTGSSGYLGTHIRAYLRSQGYRVYDICMRTDRIPFLGDGILIHAAGQLRDEESATLEEANTRIDRRIIKALDGAGHFIFLSSVAVDTRANSYAQSKKKSELLFQAECCARNIPYLAIRVPHVFGGTLKENRYSVIHNFLRRSAQGLPLELIEDNEIHPIYMEEFLCSMEKNIAKSTTGILKISTPKILVSHLIKQISELPENTPTPFTKQLNKVRQFYASGVYDGSAKSK